MSIQPLTNNHIEKFRLLLSTYQDGTGRDTKDRTLPGWEDFEDVTEIVFNGKRLKSKSAFDIIVKNDEKSYGISCKITKTLKSSKSRVLIEHSRVNAEFFNNIKAKTLTREHMMAHPNECGTIILDLMKEKRALSAKEHDVQLDSSFFLVMAYDVKDRKFRLFQFPLKMPRADKVTWSFSESGKHLKGTINGELVLQWFHEGGGQIKYYPTLKKANWISEEFSMETFNKKPSFNLLIKVEKYFKEKWNGLS